MGCFRSNLSQPTPGPNMTWTYLETFRRKSDGVIPGYWNIGSIAWNHVSIDVAYTLT